MKWTKFSSLGGWEFRRKVSLVSWNGPQYQFS